MHPRRNHPTTPAALNLTLHTSLPPPKSTITTTTSSSSSPTSPTPTATTATTTSPTSPFTRFYSGGGSGSGSGGDNPSRPSRHARSSISSSSSADAANPANNRSRSQSPLRHSIQHIYSYNSQNIYNNSIPPKNQRTQSFNLTPLPLRRRPSKVDLALRAERSRCSGDAIERQGLDLMEPRPVDMGRIPMDLMFRGDGGVGMSGLGMGISGMRPEPRFVMGGIFEVMEGRG